MTKQEMLRHLEYVSDALLDQIEEKTAATWTDKRDQDPNLAEAWKLLNQTIKAVEKL